MGELDVDTLDYHDYVQALNDPSVARDFLMTVQELGYEVTELPEAPDELDLLPDSLAIDLALKYWNIVYLNECTLQTEYVQ